MVAGAGGANINRALDVPSRFLSAPLSPNAHAQVDELIGIGGVDDDSALQVTLRLRKPSHSVIGIAQVVVGKPKPGLTRQDLGIKRDGLAGVTRVHQGSSQ